MSGDRPVQLWANRDPDPLFGQRRWHVNRCTVEFLDRPEPDVEGAPAQVADWLAAAPAGWAPVDCYQCTPGLLGQAVLAGRHCLDPLTCVVTHRPELTPAPGCGVCGRAAAFAAGMLARSGVLARDERGCLLAVLAVDPGWLQLLAHTSWRLLPQPGRTVPDVAATLARAESLLDLGAGAGGWPVHLEPAAVLAATEAVYADPVRDRLARRRQRRTVPSHA